jgi:hypothetical protein
MLNIYEAKLITLENATAWMDSSEKTMFMVELLEAFSIDEPGFDEAMEALEAEFDALLNVDAERTADRRIREMMARNLINMLRTAAGGDEDKLRDVAQIILYNEFVDDEDEYEYDDYIGETVHDTLD